MGLTFDLHTQVDNAGDAYVSVRSFCNIHLLYEHESSDTHREDMYVQNTVRLDQIALEQIPSRYSFAREITLRCLCPVSIFCVFHVKVFSTSFAGADFELGSSPNFRLH